MAVVDGIAELRAIDIPPKPPYMQTRRDLKKPRRCRAKYGQCDEVCIVFDSLGANSILLTIGPETISGTCRVSCEAITDDITDELPYVQSIIALIQTWKAVRWWIQDGGYSPRNRH